MNPLRRLTFQDRLDIVRETPLPARAKAILYTLLTYSGCKDRCQVTIAEIAKGASVSRQTAARYCRVLEQHGLIAVFKQHRRANWYRIILVRQNADAA